jgi:hypothetical protein
VLLGILQTAHRFRTKRQLWTYSGLGIEVHSSADHEVVNGQLQRKKKHVEIRGLNENCNHDLKNLFKGAAVVASTKPGPLPPFCFVGFGTDGLRRKEAMKTADRENPNRWANVSRNRAHGATGQNRPCSFKWAGKQEKFQPREMFFYLTFPFIELTSMSGPSM